MMHFQRWMRLQPRFNSSGQENRGNAALSSIDNGSNCFSPSSRPIDLVLLPVSVRTKTKVTFIIVCTELSLVFQSEGDPAVKRILDDRHVSLILHICT
jgi:hypothetical protein